MTRTATRRRRIGKTLTCLAALVPAAGAIIADWNKTHVYNPHWPPHAKFHNAQTITLAWVAAGLAIWESARPGPSGGERTRRATIYGGLFWLTQVPAAFFPGSALADPDTPLQPTVRFGVPINQVTATAAIILPLLAAGEILQSAGRR
ncbi:DUF6640 family protein [Amycolatopsis sp. NPDC004378]